MLCGRLTRMIRFDPIFDLLGAGGFGGSLTSGRAARSFEAGNCLWAPKLGTALFVDSVPLAPKSRTENVGNELKKCTKSPRSPETLFKNFFCTSWY